MGIYLQVPEKFYKANQLKVLYGASVVERPAHFSDVPEDKYLLCVVSNPSFDAVGVAYSEKEYIEFALPDDPRNPHRDRPRTWMLIDKDKAHEQIPSLPHAVETAPTCPAYIREIADQYGVSY